MSTAYLDNLKNIAPARLADALTALGVDQPTREQIYMTLYKDQVMSTAEDAKASALPHISNEDIEEGRWISGIGFRGRITDAQMDSVGIAETKRVVVVVDGRMYGLDPDTEVVIFKMPEVPAGA